MYNKTSKGFYVLVGAMVLMLIVLVIILVAEGSLVNVVGFGNEVTITALDNAVEIAGSNNNLGF